MKNLSLVEFAQKTASEDPVPGGGSIAALCGGLSAALAEMVSGLTIGSKKYLDVEQEMIVVKEKANNLSLSLLDDIEIDSNAFAKVMAAFRLPKETDDQKKDRSSAIQAALKVAADVPMNVATKAYEVLELSSIVVAKGNKNAVTDGMVSAMLARTAVLSALLNVKINLSSIKDDIYVNNMSKKVIELEEKTIEKENKIISSIKL